MRRQARRLISAASAIAALTCGSATGSAALVVPDGGFVIHGSTADVKAGIDLAHEAGARWVSLANYWEFLEPQPDSYQSAGGPGTAAWSELEEQLVYARSRGHERRAATQQRPGWASAREGVSDDPPTAANMRPTATSSPTWRSASVPTSTPTRRGTSRTGSHSGVP